MTVTATTPAASTKPAAKRTRKPAPAPANPVLSPEEAAAVALAARLEELKTAYVAARTGEAGTKKLLKSAKEQWENSRVITSRLAYAVAMLQPNGKGEANLSYAARELVMTAESLALTGQAYKDKQKSANSTLRNYVAAGIALEAAGHCPRGEEDKGNTSEPTAEERKVVAEAFRNGNRRDAQAPASTKDGGTGDGEEGGEEGVGGSTPSNGDAMTATDLVGHIARLQATFKLIVANSVPVSEDEAANIAGMLSDFAAELSSYADSE